MFIYAESYPLYPIFAFIGFVLVLIPLPWHFQAWNAGTCLFMIWTALACLNNFVNSVVWRDNFTDWAPVWCDISTRITIGVSVAIPAASLCINRRLYMIAACKTVNVTKSQRRRGVMVDCAIGLGIPFLQMILQYIVQGHRYNILEGIGCYPTTYNTPLAYPLSYLWPNVIGLVSAIYCILSLREFNRRRAQFALLLSANSTSALSVTRYFRLMALATIELLFNTPISAYGLYLTITHDKIRPWVSWADTHFDYGTIDVFPALLWRASPVAVVTVELSRWAVVFCAFVFFAFFGFAAEARKHYHMAFVAVTTKVGINTGALRFPWSRTGITASSKTSNVSSALPVSFPPTPQKQRPDSLSPSLTDTSTDFDDVDIKGDFAPPSPASSAAPEYTARDVLLMGPRIGDIEMGRREIAPGAYAPHAFPTPEHIELGAYAASPASTSSRSLRTLDNARPRPHVPDAFFPSGSSSSSRSSHASSSSSSSSSSTTSSTHSSPVSLHATLPTTAS